MTTKTETDAEVETETETESETETEIEIESIRGHEPLKHKKTTSLIDRSQFQCTPSLHKGRGTF